MEKQQRKKMWQRVLTHLDNNDYYILTLESHTRIKGFTTDAIKGNNVPPTTRAFFQRELEKKLSDLRLKPLKELSWLKNFSFDKDDNGQIKNARYEGHSLDALTDPRQLAQCLTCLLSSRNEDLLELAGQLIEKLPEPAPKSVPAPPKNLPQQEKNSEKAATAIPLDNHEKIVAKLQKELDNKSNTLAKKREEVTRVKAELKQSKEKLKAQEATLKEARQELHALKEAHAQTKNTASTLAWEGFYKHKLFWWHGNIPDDAKRLCPHMPFHNFQFKALNKAEYDEIQKQIKKAQTQILYYDPQYITTGELAIMKRVLYAKGLAVALVPLSINAFIEESRRYEG